MIELQIAIREAREQERRRCVGIVLRHSELATLRGDQELAKFLTALASELEHGLLGAASTDRIGEIDELLPGA